MKKFLLTLSMFSAVAVFAEEPAVDAAAPVAKPVAARLMEKVSSYVPATPACVNEAVATVRATIAKNPLTAVAVTAVATFAVIKAVEYASASNADEDDNF